MCTHSICFHGEIRKMFPCTPPILCCVVDIGSEYILCQDNIRTSFIIIIQADDSSELSKLIFSDK